MNNLFLFDNHRSIKIHLIGIGGIGMSAIAQLLHAHGCQVQGSDCVFNDAVEHLIKIGIKFFLGHASSNINNAHLIIYSSAIDKNNVELTAAIRENKIIIHRSDVIAQFSQLKRTIAISGSHGKTTTTAMMSAIFDCAGFDHTLIVGGIVNECNNNIKVGQGNWLIVEADESDGTMININPEIIIITNIDSEHLEYYKSLHMLQNAFYEFLNKVPDQGFVVLPQDILYNGQCEKITYGLHDADLIASNIRQYDDKSLFDLRLRDKSTNLLIKDMELSIIGKHNVYNALAVISAAIKLNIKVQDIRKALANFSGVKRRFSLIGSTRTVKFFDDYAHHPKEIEALLMTAKSIAQGRVICVIQPHRFTRLKNFFDQFVEVLIKFDYVIIMDVYSSGEESIFGFTSSDLNNYIISQGFYNVVQANCVNSITIAISKLVKKYDFFLFIGAGNITKIAYEVAANIEVMHYDI